ncbi:cyclic peptide export ABC transporter [Lysinibacillus sp. NPDC058147]|uniref:cyclic peptide export ABC transporter n=1 Tax=unclassified Lysinibacillus TaxID=2636778 RepID=UPI0036D9F10E
MVSLKKKIVSSILTLFVLLFGTVQYAFANTEMNPTANSVNFDISQYGILLIIISIIVGLLTALTFYFLVKLVIELIRKQRNFIKAGAVYYVTRLLGLVVLLTFVGYSFYRVPETFLAGLTWSEFYTQLPASALWSVYLILAFVVLISGLIVLEAFSEKVNDKSYFSIIILSLLSGGSYAFVMFVVNMALKNQNELKFTLGIYFVLGLVLYIFSQKRVRKQLTIMTNNLVFNKRLELMNKLLNSPYYKFEKVGKEKIFTSLNNDTEVISNSIGLIVIGVTSTVTILISFIYLGISNIYALLTSVFFVVIAGIMLVLVNQSAHRLYSKTRDIQNTFFKFINDLVSGYKELYLHKGRKEEFRAEMIQSCDNYRKKRTDAELVGTNVYFVGELMAFIILGGLIFLLPIVYKSISNVTLTDYVLIFLFLKGPIDNVLNMIPGINRVKVSWQRVQEMSKQVTSFEQSHIETTSKLQPKKEISLTLKDISYMYKNNENEQFTVGPINYTFNTGEIVFVTGGNGSGKSTLGKLITGLYAPDHGVIQLNGENTQPEQIGQYFSTVFSDYYLFDRIYGIDFTKEKDRIETLMVNLGIDEKLKINNGEFSTTKLSTGQRKRLALLISCIDDRPIYLFDEWASDQDPEFRKYFYETLIPEMKQQGKGVIAITHDDRYFHIADKVIKMEIGKLVDETKQMEVGERN